MNIQGFFQLSCGRWFTQRTCHQLGQASSEAHTAQMTVEFVDLADPGVKALSKDASIDLKYALCAVRIAWQEQDFQPQPPKQGQLIMVPIATTPTASQGQIFQGMDSGDINSCNFKMGADQKLVLTGDLNPLTLEEQIWFASPNLRLRMSLLKQANQLHQATWYSEVRMGTSPQSTPEERPQAASTQ
ncbi:phycobiliprotein lyase [Acaryochloris sp. IP29b_bin.137]|uniref:phycobiliprotein lyase n=1 Tax=Acaryochloris sp. IP29b_bin.137 TaxID=2969217 RepID=UPI0026175E7C|nr:phycobiliprotein lyase [Acaryochloris sp. IP29b_bin.137]